MDSFVGRQSMTSNQTFLGAALVLEGAGVGPQSSQRGPIADGQNQPGQHLAPPLTLVSPPVIIRSAKSPSIPPARVLGWP